MKKYLVIAMAVIILFSHGLLAVHATSQPLVRDVFLSPGEAQEITFPLINSAEITANFQISFVRVDFDALGEPIIQKDEDADVWLNTPQKDFTLAPATQEDIEISVSAPENIESGVYTFGVLVTQSVSGFMPVNYGTMTIIFVTVGDLDSIAICKTLTLQKDGQIHIVLQNNGQGILYWEEGIHLRSPIGVQFGEVLSNPLQRRILSGQTREIVSDKLVLPWWSIGPVFASVDFQDNSSSLCPPVYVGFGWLPLVVLFGGAGTIIFITRRH